MVVYKCLSERKEKKTSYGLIVNLFENECWCGASFVQNTIIVMRVDKCLCETREKTSCGSIVGSVVEIEYWCGVSFLQNAIMS